MTIPSSRSLILWISVFSITSPSADFGRLRKTSDFFGRLWTSSGIFGNDRVVFKNPSTPRIKISRLYLRNERSFHRGLKTEISREALWHIWNSPLCLFLVAAAHSGCTGLFKVNETLVFILIGSSCLMLLQMSFARQINEALTAKR